MKVSDLLNRIKKYMDFKHCVIRMIMAWCFVCLVEAVVIGITTEKQLGNIAYVGEISIGMHMISVILVFICFYVLLEVLKGKWIEKISLILMTCLYAFFAVVQTPDIYFCTGMTALLVFTFAYAFEDVNTAKISVKKRTSRIILVVSGLFFVVFTGGCTALRVLAYEAPNFDMGLFSQMFHYMKTTLTMNTTSERDGLLSHMCVHISPDFYLLLPFYAVFSSPVTLQVMQAVVIALGLIPLMGICKNHGLSRLEQIFIGAAYCFYPVMSGGCFYDVHENLFLPLFILCLLYFFEKESWRGILISMVLLFGVKEDAAIYGVFIALYMLLEKRKTIWKKSVTVIVCCFVYFIFTTVLLAHIGDGVMTYRFNNMVYGGNGSMLGMVRTVLVNPAYLVKQMFTAEKLEFLLQTLGSLCFIPLLSKRWTRYILFGPFVLFNLMSDYVYFHNIYFQYVFGSGALLLYLAVINVADFSPKIRSRAIPMMAAACVMFFGATVWQRTAIVQRYTDSYNQTVYENFKEALSLIPEDATVTATTFLCPALSNHDILYELHYTDETTEYIALDLRVGSTDYNVADYLDNPRYETVYYQTCQIAVFRDLQYSQE